MALGTRCREGPLVARGIVARRCSRAVSNCDAEVEWLDDVIELGEAVDFLGEAVV